MTDHAKPTWDAPPDVAGSRGRAWRFDIERWQHAAPDTRATICMWLLNCPHAHPFWEWWLVAGIHLRSIDGVKPAVVTVPGATHEVSVVSMDPQHEPPDPKTSRSANTFRILKPLDVVQQFRADSDADAADFVEALVLACCDGRLSPDSDYRRMWAAYAQAES